MNGLEFIASLVHALAWPAAVAWLLYTFRADIAKLFEGLASRIRTGNISVEGAWGKARIEESLDAIAEDVEGLRPVEASDGVAPQSDGAAEDPLDWLAARDPDAAVLKCWAQVERSLRGFAIRRDVAVEDRDGRRLIEAIESTGEIDRAAFDAVRRLLAIRNIVARYEVNTGPSGMLRESMKRQQALDYIASARKLIAYFDSDRNSAR